MDIILVSMDTTSRAHKGLQLQSYLGYWLRRVSNAVSGAFPRALHQKQTSVAEWVLLRELHERGQTAPAELADGLGSPVAQFLESSTNSTQRSGSKRMQKRATAGSACFLPRGQDAAISLSWLRLLIETMHATSIV
jgi:hypothetical protein